MRLHHFHHPQLYAFFFLSINFSIWYLIGVAMTKKMKSSYQTQLYCQNYNILTNITFFLVKNSTCVSEMYLSEMYAKHLLLILERHFWITAKLISQWCYFFLVVLLSFWVNFSFRYLKVLHFIVLYSHMYCFCTFLSWLSKDIVNVQNIPCTSQH